MSRRILRGRVLSFVSEPQGRDDHASYSYIEDGAVEVENGVIVRMGAFEGAHAPDARIIDHRPNLIMAGFIDPHIHFPQMQVIGAYAGALLEWLNTYTFVEEQKFGDLDHATRIAS
ncbi:MAG: guanine deaminase, partial [Devosia sp.]|nr:guanine deaminase [Devosia sp.]